MSCFIQINAKISRQINRSHPAIFVRVMIRFSGLMPGIAQSAVTFASAIGIRVVQLLAQLNG